MECSRIRSNLAEYVDGDLPPDERLSVEKHLCTCSACKREAELLRRAMCASVSLLRHPHPEDRFAALRRQMAEADLADAQRKWTRPRLGSGRVLRGLAVAAVLALAVAAILPLLAQGAVRDPGGATPIGAAIGNGPVFERIQLITEYRQAAESPAMPASLPNEKLGERSVVTDASTEDDD
jgi:anti-sigma factor RsiW